jgi:nitrate reductase gamma subunit
MALIMFLAALSAYALFISRFAWQAVLWFRSSGQTALYPVFRRKMPAVVCLSTLLDVLFFRRLFAASKLLWLGSWIFHVSFILVALRHMRYFFPSLPDCLILIQPAGVCAGYLLPLSLLYLLVLRIVRKKDRYASSYNYAISGALFLISATGVLMRTFFRPDPVSVKQFGLGIFSLSPQALPDSPAFILHSSMFLLLLPFLPSHILAAPFVNLEANRRREELRFIIHDA